MKPYIYKCVSLLVVLLAFGCSHSQPRMQSKPAIERPKTAPMIVIADRKDSGKAVTKTAEENTPALKCPGNIGCPDDVNVDVQEDNGQYPEALQDSEISDTVSAETEDPAEDPENAGNEEELLDTALDLINASQEFWADGSLEKAIETLDRAYGLILKVDTENRPDLIQQQEDLRFMTAKRILEIYASRYKAVNGNHREIPLTMNEHVEMEIKSFQGPERHYFIESYKRSGLYIDKIRAALREAGMPEELAWMPHIESWFKVKALSSARALGIWQFIPSTGYKFGLKRDAWIDERMDPEKSTAAAIAYLKELHQLFGDWTTVLAAYNCGEGAVLRRISNQKINYLDNFWDLYNQLPRETARYVPRFLATLHIMKDPAKYGFTFDEIEQPLNYETVTVQKQVQLKTVAESLGISLEELTALNPELRLQVTPPNRYNLRVPAEKKDSLLACIDTLPAWAASGDDLLLSSSAYVYHRVRTGETLAGIAKKYHSSTRSIARVNNLNRSYFIRAGQKLKIPLSSSTANSYTAKTEVPSNGKYRVKRGDTLWLIARKFNTNTRTLQQLNNLRSTNLKTGQILTVTE
ncbi:MAG: LysM peptidoglycan-binding domain-containing protein [Nitrospirota bacterium]